MRVGEETIVRIIRGLSFLGLAAFDCKHNLNECNPFGNNKFFERDGYRDPFKITIGICASLLFLCDSGPIDWETETLLGNKIISVTNHFSGICLFIAGSAIGSWVTFE